uniref:RRM domain-containing protein n=1 Tax=Anguilla anguilla TaxID=7936 RepID=A0A0E9PCW1_ANGAN
MESKPVHITTFQEQLTRKRATSRRNTRYLRLYGLPKSITRQEINHFFKGLHVEDCYCQCQDWAILWLLGEVC